MGSIKRNYGGSVGLLVVVVGLLLPAAAALAEGQYTNCAVKCRGRNDLTACLYRCRFGRTPLRLHLAAQESAQEVDLLMASEADCAAYCRKHARDFPGKFGACMRMCQSWPGVNAGGDKILLRIKEEEEKKKQQDDVLVQLGTSCDECGNTESFREYIGCLIENNCN